MPAMAALSTQLLVIGGGATGLGVAWDACLRGIKVLLVEQSDLGQGTSGRYHGLLHSGGRYVISDPTSARDCAAENRILRRLAPSTIEDTGGFFVVGPDDPLAFADDWLLAAHQTGVAAEEIDVGEALRAEPLLSPRIQRVFKVHDAAMDSFDLMHLLQHAIEEHGGQVWLRHQVVRLTRSADRITGAEILSHTTGERAIVGAEVVVNAAGPWSGEIASMAGVDLPIALGKGTMVAMATRLVNTIVNRCKPPADGDIVVPVGTVTVLGTTDVPVASPNDLVIEPWEIDLLLKEGRGLLPSLGEHRPLRAWAGIRPLHRPPALDEAAPQQTRALPRAHSILDHADTHGVDGFVSVIGGKLTTFRLMAEETLAVVAPKLRVEAPCPTAQVPLAPRPRPFHRLPDRLRRLRAGTSRSAVPGVLCECETVSRAELEAALASDRAADLDAIRRDLRLGMGPCQAAFCGYRAAGVARETDGRPFSPSTLPDFLEERWRGIRPLAWGHMLRQVEFSRRVALELLGVEPETEPVR